MFILTLLTILLPDGNFASLSADSSAIVAGPSKTTLNERVVEFPQMRINPLKKVKDFCFSPDVARILLTRADGDTALIAAQNAVCACINRDTARSHCADFRRAVCIRRAVITQLCRNVFITGQCVCSARPVKAVFITRYRYQILDIVTNEY